MLDRFLGYSLKETGVITTTASAELQNPNPEILSIVNSGSATIYIGHDATVTTATGYPLEEGKQVLFNGPFYTIGVGELRYAKLEVV